MQESKQMRGESVERRRLSEAYVAKDDFETRAQSKLAERVKELEEENLKLRARVESAEKDASTDLEEKTSIESKFRQLEIRYATQSKQMDAKSSEVADLKRTLARERQEKQDLELQMQELQAQLADSETRSKRNQAQSDKVAKVEKYEKENKSLKQKMQDQHSKMRDLETELRKAACQGRTPGDIWRMVESIEAKNHFSEENNRMRSLATELETERNLMRKEVDLFRKRLSPEVCAAIRREAADAVAAAALENSEGCGVQPFRELSPQLTH